MGSAGSPEFGRRLMAAGERLRYELEGLDPERLFPEEVVRRPDIWGIQRRCWSIAKTTGTLLRGYSLWWMLLESLQTIPPQVFCLDAIGQIVEIYRQCGPINTPGTCAAEEMRAVSRAES